MNHYSKLLQQSLTEFDEWLRQRPSTDTTDIRFYESIKNHLKEAVNSDSQQVDNIVKTILHMLADSAPIDLLREDVLPSFQQVANVVQKRKKQ
jgi:hypothetical protein